MSRDSIRQLKRAVAAVGTDNSNEVRLLAQASALALLARSIRFGHERLALIRLVMALHAGADVPDEHWLYCERVATAGRQPELLASLHEAQALRQRPFARESPRMATV